MNLWIRSQDKERLLKIQSLEYVKDDYGFYILGNEDKFSKYKLATYKSKERAVEVLDEIQKLLMPQVKVIHNKTEEVKLQDFTSNIIAQPVIEDIQIQQASSYVYEMPKE